MNRLVAAVSIAAAFAAGCVVTHLSRPAQAADTVMPQITNAILSKHNFILLGLRGQARRA